jgi:hypothetical protein
MEEVKNVDVKNFNEEMKMEGKEVKFEGVDVEGKMEEVKNVGVENFNEEMKMEGKEVKFGKWDLSGVEGLEGFDLGEVYYLSEYKGYNFFLKDKINKNITLGEVIGWIKDSLQILDKYDEYAEDIKALVKMSDDEWRVQSLSYASKYEEYAQSYDIDAYDIDDLKNYLIEKVHPEYFDMDVNDLADEVEFLHDKFKKTVEIWREDGKHKIRVRDMIDENDSH